MGDIKDYPNLVSNSDRSPEERRAFGAAGGRASGAARRRYRTMREILRQILTMETTDEQRLAALKALGLDGTYAESIQLTMSAKAEAGDVEAARFVRDTVGEKPREALEVGNLDDKPFEALDLSQLTEAQLRELAAKRQPDVANSVANPEE